MVELDKLKWNKHGLIPAIAQDYRTKEVLMLAYMNMESLKLTLKKGEAVYYSRSRKELWHKGETSGHFQKVKDIYYDCDKDTLLLEVEQIGVACHEGDRSCFHYRLENLLKSGKDIKVEASNNNEVSFGKTIGNLEEVINSRYKEKPKGAYTTYLFEKGIDKILKKVGEEASEVIIASKNKGNDELIYEASDLIYHLLVLFREKGVTINDIEKELKKRFK